MSEKDKSMLPRLELLLLAGFLVFITFWAASQCSSKRQGYQKKAEKQRIQELEDSLGEMAFQRPKDTIAKKPNIVSPSTKVAELSRLYVTIKGLKMRDKPGLNGELIAELTLHDEVYFMNEVTKYMQEINLGKQVVKEPWVKIQTQKGQVGWVFGAGVSYYKTVHPGAD
jgi:lipopolysaccharide export LptBFGC system permease protein LptF